MLVRNILGSKGHDVITIEPTATLGAAVEKLSEHGIGALVVTGPGDRVAGILSERDIVRMVGEEGAAALDKPVGVVMTRKVVTATGNETVTDIMERMTAGKFRHVPIVEGSKLTGIISIGDVVKYRLQEMEQESNALRNYILTA